MNRDFGYVGGVSNQIAFMSAAGIFSNTVTELNALRALAPVTNAAASREWRVRSYVAANCAQCHQPGGAALGYWNANITNFTVDANIINGPLVNNFGNPAARVATPPVVANSMLHTRIATRGATQMPPLATSLIDSDAVSLVSSWIDSGAWTNFTAPPNVSIAATNGGTAIRFIQPANRAFRVEFATNLAIPVPWQFLDVPQNRPFYPATANAVSIIDSTSSSQKFYRVRLSTP
jgi:mono/diheme cytochrome c family protein